ncbi:MAG: hypothetical protein ACYTE3_13095 [Planctomycetota bacterium]|jgi:hypothetical protein
MTEEPEEIKLSTEQKTELLHIGLEAAAGGTQDKADLLYDILSNPLPLDASAVNMLPAPLRGLSRRVRSVAGAPIVELLKSPDTSMSTIETIKEYAKRSGKSAGSEYLTEVFLSIYYAAIACGLMFHGRKITEHSWDHLVEAFRSLAEKDWVQEELVNLLKRAQEYCGREIGQVDRPDGSSVRLT